MQLITYIRKSRHLETYFNMEEVEEVLLGVERGWEHERREETWLEAVGCGSREGRGEGGGA
jgi:hypothetical protein